MTTKELIRIEALMERSGQNITGIRPDLFYQPAFTPAPGQTGTKQCNGTSGMHPATAARCSSGLGETFSHGANTN